MTAKSMPAFRSQVSSLRFLAGCGSQRPGADVFRSPASRETRHLSLILLGPAYPTSRINASRFTLKMKMKMKITKRTQFKKVPRCAQWNELLPGNKSRDLLKPAMPISPERWERFSLSPGERAGVRASVKLFKSSAFYIMKDDRQRVRSKPLREVPALNSPSRCQEPFH